MKYLLFFVTSFLTFPLFAQQDRGAAGGVIIQPNKPVYALIIGVSDYENLPDLQFAHRDAEEFKAFLLNSMQVPAENVHLFLNDETTLTNILDDLNTVKNSIDATGATIYMYFAGHGDLEAKGTANEESLLLLYQALSQNYLLKDDTFIKTKNLNAVVNELIALGNVEVVMVADACHSGALVGGDDGRKALGATLASEWSKSIRLLACQPNETSKEYADLGGGRGVFSYYLVEGLKGFANRINDPKRDSTVSLLEIRRYLEDKVIEFTNAHQTPIVSGNSNFVLSQIKASLPTFPETPLVIAASPSGTRGVITTLSDTSDKKNLPDYYKKYETALKENRLLEPENDCILIWYQKIQSAETKADLLQSTKRKTLTVLQKKSLEVLQPLMKGESSPDLNEKAEQAAKELRAAMNIMGEKHLLYKTLQARAIFLEAIKNKDKTESLETITSKMGALEKSNSLEPNVPYTKSALGYYYLKAERYDLAEKAYLDYLKLLPNDAAAFNNLGIVYKEKGMRAKLSNDKVATDANFKKAKDYLNKSIQKDSIYAMPYNNLGTIFLAEQDTITAIQYYEKAIQIQPKYSSPQLNLGNIYRKQNRAKAMAFYQKAVENDASNAQALVGLGLLEAERGNQEQAISFFKRATEQDSLLTTAFNNLGDSYNKRSNDRANAKTDDLDNAMKCFNQAIKIDRFNKTAYMNLGVCYFRKGEAPKAIAHLKRAIALDGFYTTAYRNLGNVYKTLDKKDSTIFYLDKAILHASDKEQKSRTINDKGNAFFKFQEYAEAEKMYQEAMQKLPDDYRAYYNMACLTAKQSQAENALTWLEKALEKDSARRISKESLKNDDDLELIRETRAFRKLVDKMR